ncbi:carboxymuconolactone decarboxylase family protein [Burkholderia arboris]|nr:carboxymuconolactone decarboxylase family protein [Burkholderia arboris]UTV60600.1 carboxymuconolactone decarboxylase family protein [Burkholderia arboris]
MSVIHAIGHEGFSSLSAALDRLDPDFKRLLVEGAYADIIARPNLSLEHRELVTVAVLATMGNAESTLKYHAGGMLNTGWAPEAVAETVFQTLYYAGVPVAMAGIRHVAALLRERGIDVSHEVDLLGQYETAVACLFQRRQAPCAALTHKERRLAALAIVIASENQHDAVRHHLQACLRVGWTRCELTEVLIQLTGYIGWPLVLPVARIALGVFDAAEGCASAEQTHAFAERQSREPDRYAPAGIAEIAPDLARHLDEPGATTASLESIEQEKARHLTAIACLTCLARNADADLLATHMHEARSLGATRHEAVEAIVGALPYAGMLAVQSALLVANRLFAPADPHATAAHRAAAT